MRQAVASSRRIYLDYNASTPIAPEVSAAMGPLLHDHYGNPSSAHWAGAPARTELEEARAEVGALIGASPDEVVFTSGGSEANNTALKGVYFDRARGATGGHVITTMIEHPAIHAPCEFLETLGARVTRLPVDPTGMVDPDDVRRAIRVDTVLISVMHANNEVGTLEPIGEIARIAREREVPLHTDAAQSVGKIPVDVAELGVDLLSLAGHKLYAPKGVGALFVRSGLRIEPLVHGAGHERGRRAGTESALLAVGLGTACRLARERPYADRASALVDHFWAGLDASFGDRVVRNGHPTRCLPNTLNVSFPGRLGQDLLGRLDGVAASTGSACHTGAHVMSPVLAAMGRDEATGLGAIRFSVGRETTRDEIDAVVERLRELLGC